MRAIRGYFFYGAIFLYAAYNFCWLVGTMFSFGKNDTQKELVYFVLTFVADIPVLWWLKRNVKLGGALFAVLLLTSMWLAKSEHVLNGVTFLYWYSPKVVPLLAAVWANRAERCDSSVAI
jgi:hypothetical protein